MSGTPHVSVQPGMYSGEPCIDGHRLPTRMMADYIYSGVEDIDSLAREYDLTRDQVMVALWFEARHGRSRAIRRHWKNWLAENEGTLWKSAGWDAVPPPPAAREQVPA